MHLLLALDRTFEHLAAVAITSFLLHQKFESLVIVSPETEKFELLERISKVFEIPYYHYSITHDSSLHLLGSDVRPYFYCIEALNQQSPGRYLYVDADTLCVSNLDMLSSLQLDANTPLAACSHGRPMPDRSLILGLQSEFHYFNAGILLFDSMHLGSILSPKIVVDFYLKNQVICRFREQCSLNALLRSNVKFIPSQFNLLSWMRARNEQHPWQDMSINSMAYCLQDVRNNMSIVHFSNGTLPDRIPSERHERVDKYWLLLEKNLSNPVKMPLYSDLW